MLNAANPAKLHDRGAAKGETHTVVH